MIMFMLIGSAFGWLYALSLILKMLYKIYGKRKLKSLSYFSGEAEAQLKPEEVKRLQAAGAAAAKQDEEAKTTSAVNPETQASKPESSGNPESAKQEKPDGASEPKEAPAQAKALKA